ncbi:hypothetical protein PAXRUDRAFT_160874, partial [Paxillus rubicundulus Ve08.2h10]
RAAKPLVKYGGSVTAQDVIKVQKKDNIQKIIEEEHGAKPGDWEMIAKYQWAVNKVMGGLTQEEIKEAKRLVEEWRKTRPLAEVQDKTASQKGEKYLREFSEEMWRQCRIRVAVLTAWKDGSGQMMTTQYVINDQIEDEESFDGWGGIHQRWMEYAKKVLGDLASDEEESSMDTDSHSDSSPAEKKKKAKKCRKAKVDAVSMVTTLMGHYMLVDIPTMEQMVWEFITFHYRQASAMKGGSVPWMKISTQRSNYISGKYLPQGTKLWEPFKLQKKEVISLLEFWRERQRSDPANVFSFRKWRDATRTLQDPVEFDPNEEQASQRRMAAKGKRKAAHNHGLTDPKWSEEEQGGPTNKEEPSNVSGQPSAQSKYHGG